MPRNITRGEATREPTATLPMMPARTAVMACRGTPEATSCKFNSTWRSKEAAKT